MPTLDLNFRYVWLLWAGGFLLPWAAPVVARPAFRRPMLWASVLTALLRNCLFARLLIVAAVFLVSFLSAQQPDTPFTLDAALAYARQHSPRLSAKNQGVTTERAGIAMARAERLPRLTLGAAARVSSQPTQTAMGFPLTQLADIPENQPFRRGHLNAGVMATIPLHTGGRISSGVSLAQAQRDVATANVHDVERDLDFDVTSTYANLVQLDRDIDAARESVNALAESRRVVAQMLDEGKVARIDLLKVDTRLADVQDTAIEFRNAREIEAGQRWPLRGLGYRKGTLSDADLRFGDVIFRIPSTGQLRYLV